ncbi:MAG: ComEA family DNA-binding protein [SAR202 cluster bacterium]|nr:ComEA family DNA-binding protein [SAR202 cluster bacterium]
MEGRVHIVRHVELPFGLTLRLAVQAVLALAVAAALAGTIFLLVRSGSAGEGIELVVLSPTATQVVVFKVYVTGAVRNPGVYEVKAGDRLAEVLAAAGGPTEGADLIAVNLAARVRDEEHRHVPKVGEAVEVAGGADGPSGVVSASGRLDINTATADELVALPGIGQVRAQAIIRYRDANGPFARVEDLLEVEGIGPATLEAIRDLIEVR